MWDLGESHPFEFESKGLNSVCDSDSSDFLNHGLNHRLCHAPISDSEDYATIQSWRWTSRIVVRSVVQFKTFQTCNKEHLCGSNVIKISKSNITQIHPIGIIPHKYQM